MQYLKIWNMRRTGQPRERNSDGVSPNISIMVAGYTIPVGSRCCQCCRGGGMKAGPLEIAAPSASLRAIEAIDVVVRSMISRDYAACAVKNIGAAHRLKNFSLEEWCEDVWRSEGLFWGIGPHSVYVRWASASPSGETWALAYDVPGGYRVLSSDPVPDQCRLSRCRKHCLGGFWEALSRYICHDIGQDTVRSLRLDLW